MVVHAEWYTFGYEGWLNSSKYLSGFLHVRLLSEATRQPKANVYNTGATVILLSTTDLEEINCVRDSETIAAISEIIEATWLFFPAVLKRVWVCQLPISKNQQITQLSSLIRCSRGLLLRHRARSDVETRNDNFRHSRNAEVVENGIIRAENSSICRQIYGVSQEVGSAVKDRLHPNLTLIY